MEKSLRDVYFYVKSSKYPKKWASYKQIHKNTLHFRRVKATSQKLNLILGGGELQFLLRIEDKLPKKTNIFFNEELESAIKNGTPPPPPPPNHIHTKVWGKFLWSRFFASEIDISMS